METVLIIGLGLMGGSYGRALKKKGYRVVAINDERESVDYAIGENIIDDGWDYVNEEALRGADIVVFALYPHTLLQWVREYGHLLHSGQLITDVTGVKKSTVYDVQSVLGSTAEFIASHPMAGREVYGVRNSTDEIFKGANFIVVPTDKNTQRGIERCRNFGEALGFSEISVLSPEEHDEMIGFLSQLPHCIAVCLMNVSDNRNLVRYTGDSFRDLTRIANINGDMWCELFMMNREALLRQMDDFTRHFTAFCKMLREGDTFGMKEMMKISAERRRWFNK